MRSLIVVENTKRWPFELDGVDVVPARTYLTDPGFAAMKRVAVYNLCRRIGYQSVGYYVSLLAAARGHRPLPSVSTLQALGHLPVLRAASDELDEEIQRALSRVHSESYDLSIYFGRNLAKRYDRLARALFNHFPAPILIARFHRSQEGWRLGSLRLGATSEIPDAHRDFVLETAAAFFSRTSAGSMPTDLAAMSMVLSTANAEMGDPGAR